ncbi:MAG: M23 family metallopeptidase [Sulfurovum sp.]|nr:M23 family metallopeptidase [Sulfurovum sp.]
MAYKSTKSSGLKMVVGLMFLALLISIGYIYTAEEFERVAPTIKSADNMYWNKIKPIKVVLHDNIGLKSFDLILSDGKNSVSVGRGEIDAETKKQTLLIKYPEGKGLDPEAKKLILQVSVSDRSFWNFMQGNSNRKNITILLDYKRPNVNILSNSYSITQGGSALVVFQAEDENLDELYVEVGKVHFKAQPYREKGFYVALIAWPFNQDDFKAQLIARDIAGNSRSVDIPYYVKTHKYRTSWIQAKDSFIDGKITDLASEDPKYAGITDKIERLKAVNEKMRLANEELIHSLGKNLSTDFLTSWKITKFYPLRNGQRVASYGDERHYYYKTKDNIVSHSYHVGYDLASTKMASIKTSNAGKVVFSSSNGIYGNMPMIDHGLGLYSLYGHCSQVLVNDGDDVKAGDTIAKTGVSGLALGDHLHFGLLVQGIEVRPVEWFDQSWIRKNIDNIFKEADIIIKGQ